MTGANIPSIRFYGIFEKVTDGKPIKTPKYRLTTWGGSREYMQMLYNNLLRADKTIWVYYKKTRSQKVDAPEMVIECKDSQNLSGLFQWFEYGRLSGYAYGYPQAQANYGEAITKSNPFFPYYDDAFLFRCKPSTDTTDTIPSKIEWIVLQGKGARINAPLYRTMMMLGSFSNALESIPMVEYRAEDFSNI